MHITIMMQVDNLKCHLIMAQKSKGHILQTKKRGIIILRATHSLDLITVYHRNRK